MQAWFDGVGANGLEECVSVVVSPDGKHVYTGCHPDGGETDWLGVFARNAADGTLTFVESFRTDAFPSPRFR